MPTLSLRQPPFKRLSSGLRTGTCWLSTALLAGLLLQASVAQAQFGGGMGGMGGGMGRRAMSSAQSRESSTRDSAKTSDRTSSVDQILYQLSTLQIDLKLSTEQEAKWFEFSEAVRAYVDDQVRQKFKDQNHQNNPSENTTGLLYLSKLVDNSSHHYSDLEEIEAKAKAFYPLMNNEQRVLFDLRMSIVVTPNVFGLSVGYPNTLGMPTTYMGPKGGGAGAGAGSESMPITATSPGTPVN